MACWVLAQSGGVGTVARWVLTQSGGMGNETAPGGGLWDCAARAKIKNENLRWPGVKDEPKPSSVRKPGVKAEPFVVHRAAPVAAVQSS